jgi:hypothetical protein
VQLYLIFFKKVHAFDSRVFKSENKDKYIEIFRDFVSEYIANDIPLKSRRKSIYFVISNSTLARIIKKRKRISTDTYKEDENSELTRYL